MGLLRRGGDPGAALERRLVWMLGSPRTGSTWLTRLLETHPDVETVGEPHIGIHLAPFAPGLLSSKPLLYPRMQADRPNYFFNDEYASVWRPLVRELVLGRLGAEAGDSEAIVVKEPHGSQAAEMILAALPQSRLLFLLRDGRDVVDSEVAALAPDGWLGAEFDVQVPRLKLVEHAARTWLLRTEIVEAAYRRHADTDRYLVRYEDLLADTPARLAELFGWLGVTVDRERIQRAADELAFGQIEDTGPGRFHRSARPGAWRENLDADERRLLGELLGPKLAELGYPED
jgi:hypothetical protein